MIINNLLPKSFADKVYNNLNSSQFPWYYNDNVIGFDKEPWFQFTHLFCEENNILSDGYNIIMPILYFFEKETDITFKNIKRIKANLTTQYNLTKEQIKSLEHTDVDKDDDKYLSLIYYVNSSDGNTIIYDNKNIIEVEPEFNKLVYFNSNLKHCGVFPAKNKQRIVINFIIEK
jgi:hypothetical protein